MEKITIKGRSISRGVAEGEALVTDKSFGFSHGIDPHTGKISDEGHEWMGQDARDKVLVFPYGKGSTSGGLYVLEAAKWNNAPLAVINLETEPVVAAGFVLAELLYDKIIPVIDRPESNPIDVIQNGDRVRVDADNGVIEIYRQSG